MTNQQAPPLQRQDALAYPGTYENLSKIDSNIDDEVDDDDDLLQWEGLVRRWKKFFQNWSDVHESSGISVINRRCFSFSAKSLFGLLKGIHETQQFAYRVHSNQSGLHP